MNFDSVEFCEKLGKQQIFVFHLGICMHW